MASTAYSITYDVTNNDTYHVDCVIKTNYYTIPIIPFKIVVILINILLFVAAANDRKKLQRQNSFFICVISTLFCNSAYLLFSIYMTVDNYFQIPAEPQKEMMTTHKLIWTLTEASTLSLVVGICINVTSLIYVTLDSVYFVGRSGMEWKSSLPKKEINKARIARTLVAISWIIPVVLTVIAGLWNCTWHCHCPSSNYEGDHCPTDEMCSRMWAPLKIPFLLITVAMWFIVVVVLFIIVGRRVMEYKLAVHLPAQPNESSVAEENDQKPPVERKSDLPSDEVPAHPSVVERKSRVHRKLNSRFRFAVLLTSLLIGCTIPAAICIIIDAATDNAYVLAQFGISAGFMFIYTAVCPILMWKFLPNLKSSGHKLYQKITNCAFVSCDHKSAGNPSSPNA